MTQTAWNFILLILSNICYEVASILNIPNSPSIAVLVDAENTQLELLHHVLQFADLLGVRKISRAYGHWEESSLSTWYDTVAELSIEIVPVDAIGKDTADDQLKIDAVEILCEGQIDIFIIVAGDGDFRLTLQAY